MNQKLSSQISLVDDLQCWGQCRSVRKVENQIGSTTGCPQALSTCAQMSRPVSGSLSMNGNLDSFVFRDDNTGQLVTQGDWAEVFENIENQLGSTPGWPQILSIATSMVVDDKVEGYARLPGRIRGLEVRAVERTQSNALRRWGLEWPDQALPTATWMVVDDELNCYLQVAVRIRGLDVGAVVRRLFH